MPDLSEVHPAVDAAAQAAAAGDYESAERLLRQAAREQEAARGPYDPDLASTLNNLGIVCEMAGKPLDAERCFRRAWETAAAALPPDHPLVATSRKNLEDFCAARGQPIDVASPPPVLAAQRNAPEAKPLDPRRVPSKVPTQPAPIPEERSGPGAMPGTTGLFVAGGLIVGVIAAAMWFRSAGQVETQEARAGAPTPVSAPVSAPAPSPPSEPVVADAPQAATASREVSEPGAGTSPQPPGPAAAIPEREATSAPRPQTPVATPMVTSARLCRDLTTAGQPGDGDWPCVPPSLPLSPGRLFFYTRVTSRSDVTVQHRWYRGERLHHVVDLRISANTTRGYRTYSRNTFDSQDAGDWRVELSTSGGVVLHEERFAVR